MITMTIVHAVSSFLQSEVVAMVIIERFNFLCYCNLLLLTFNSVAVTTVTEFNFITIATLMHPHSKNEYFSQPALHIVAN